MKIILAIDPKGAIGYNNKLPWHCKEELALFRKTTWNGTLVMGKKTSLSIPVLKNRTLIIVHNTTELSTTVIPQDAWIAGGKMVYQWFLTHQVHKVNEIHLSLMKNCFEADTFLEWSLFENWLVSEYTEYSEFYHYILRPGRNQEKQYLDILREACNQPERSTRNSITKSLFCRHLVFDLGLGFPLLTTKKMYWNGIVNEFLFFLNGFTDTKWLEERKCFIWKDNTSREFLDSLGMHDRSIGQMGPMYGYQWRHFNAKWDPVSGKPLEKGLDQLADVINQIKSVPCSRRHIMTTFNPVQVHEGVLYPCHSIVIQFYVDHSSKLDMYCYNRSSDLFLGLPFNIASSSLLLTVCAKLCNLEVGKLYLSLGDCHIYQEHYEAIQTQLERNRLPYNFPKLRIDNFPGSLEEFSNLRASDFVLENYKSHSSIKGKMIP